MPRSWFLAALRDIEHAESAADLARVRVALLAHRDVITPDRQTRHAFARLMERERDLLAVEALIASAAAGRDGDAT